MKEKNDFKILRIVSLTGFLAFLTWVAVAHQVKGGGPAGAPSIDSLCPLGGLETMKLWITSGNFLRRTAPSALILFGTVFTMTLLLGRVFCGWICPLGAIGEFFAFLGRKVRLPKISVPALLDKNLKLLKYAILALILWGTVRTGTLIWRAYDPWVAWAHLAGGWKEITANPWSYSILAVTVMGASLFVERFWCRYLCPLGAALGVVGKVSLLRVGNTDPGTCKNCGLCVNACPVQLHPEKEMVPGAECLVCGKCVGSALPDCRVQFRFAGKPVRVLFTGIFALLLFLGAYGAARTLGLWKTFVPPKVSAGMTPAQIADSVFGWMNLKQVSEVTGIPVEAIKEKAQLDRETPENASMKSLGIDDAHVKEAIKEIAARSAPAKTITGSMELPSTTPAATPVLPRPAEIMGSATLQDIQGTYNLEPEAVLKEAGWPENLSQDVPLRELKTLVGKEVEEIRRAVERLLPRQ